MTYCVNCDELRRYQVMADGLWECRTCGYSIECVECGHDMHRDHRTDDTTHECTGCAICAEARSAVA